MIIFKKYVIVSVLALLSFSPVFGQFTITNPLKTRDATNLRIGDNAYLTAANGVDPNGEGWLRLTNSVVNQKGYMYVMQSFPTSFGIIADFEYLQWRNVADGNFGADGFSVFLFDGSVSDAAFKLGGYGGSLGYATYQPATNVNETGLSGGYLGIGFDAYGNYARAAENRNGGTSTTALLPNAVVVRGPTSTTYNQSNIYLSSIALGLRGGGDNAIRARDEIDYNTVTLTRPLPTTFYRRVQISITKPATNYIVTIKWRKQNETNFTQILQYTLNATTYPIPSTLKLGFAASTGGSVNFHEIRNILLTTPGNLRVDSRSDVAITCNEKKNTVTFKVEVTNDTGGLLNDITFNSKINNAANNNLMTTNQFKITEVSTTGFANTNLPTSNFTSNQISGTVGLQGNTSGIVTIKGEYIRGLKNNQKFKAVSEVSSNQILDTDLTNNVATTELDVRKCNLLSNPSMPARYK